MRQVTEKTIEATTRPGKQRRLRNPRRRMAAGADVKDEGDADGAFLADYRCRDEEDDEAYTRVWSV